MWNPHRDPQQSDIPGKWSTLDFSPDMMDTATHAVILHRSVRYAVRDTHE